MSRRKTIQVEDKVFREGQRVNITSLMNTYKKYNVPPSLANKIGETFKVSIITENPFTNRIEVYTEKNSFGEGERYKLAARDLEPVEEDIKVKYEINPI